MTSWMFNVLIIVCPYFLSLTSGLCQVPSDSCSLLWRIEGNGIRGESYLFGTMHSADARIRRFDANWMKSFNDCNLLAGETDLISGQLSMEMLTRNWISDSSLTQLLPAKYVELIGKHVQDKFGETLSPLLMQLKPFFLLVLLMEVPENLTDTENILDVYLQRKAIEEGKTLVGLESGQEQHEVAANVPLLLQAQWLAEFVIAENDLELISLTRTMEKLMNDAYLSQCIDSFPALLTLEMMDARLMYQLLPRRNERFCIRLVELMKSNRVFCAVGAMHLPGGDGMIQMLRGMGYILSPVYFRFQE